MQTKQCSLLMKTIRRKGSEYCVIQFLKYNSNSPRPNGKKKYVAYVKLGSSTSLAETPTCCDTCAGLEGDSAVEESSTAADGGAAVEVEMRLSPRDASTWGAADVAGRGEGDGMGVGSSSLSSSPIFSNSGDDRGE